MTTNIPEKKARQGGLGRPVLGVLLAALFLAIVAWGVAEIYGENAKTPATQEHGGSAAPANVPAPSSQNPGGTDPVKSKTDNVNTERLVSPWLCLFASLSLTTLFALVKI